MNYLNPLAATLQEVVARESTFINEPVMIQVSQSLESDDLLEIDFMETLGHNTRQSKDMKDKLEEVYWLPKDLHGSTAEVRKKQVGRFFKLAFKASGTRVVLNGWRAKQGSLVF